MKNASGNRIQLTGLLLLAVAATMFVAGLLTKNPALLGAGACFAGASSVALRLAHQRR